MLLLNYVFSLGAFILFLLIFIIQISLSFLDFNMPERSRHINLEKKNIKFVKNMVKKKFLIFIGKKRVVHVGIEPVTKGCKVIKIFSFF